MAIRLAEYRAATAEKQWEVNRRYAELMREKREQRRIHKQACETKRRAMLKVLRKLGIDTARFPVV